MFEDGFRSSVLFDGAFHTTSGDRLLRGLTVTSGHATVLEVLQGCAVPGSRSDCFLRTLQDVSDGTKAEIVVQRIRPTTNGRYIAMDVT